MTNHVLTTTKSVLAVIFSFVLVPVLFYFLLAEVFRPWVIHTFLFGSVNTAITATAILSILPLLFTSWYVLKHHRVSTFKYSSGF
jgi:hypothetical protein